MNWHRKNEGENQDHQKLVAWNHLQKSFGFGNLAKKKPSIRRVIVPMGLATAFHGLLILFFCLFGQNAPQKNHALQAEITFSEPKKTKNTRDPKTPKQVALVAPSPQPKRPEKAQFLAESDQSTPKEQAAILTSLDPPNLSAAPEKMGQILRKEKYAPASKANPHPKVDQEAPSIDDYLEPKPQTPKNDDPLGILPKDLGNSFRDAMPFADNLRGLKQGDKTELNTWQWLHAPFFNRIKSKVAKVWSPQHQIARYDPTGSLLGLKDRITVIRVSIDRTGSLQSVSLVESSGVAYLDEEAERAFRSAAPFPFPPKELFDENGSFAFEFSFRLQIDHGLSFDFDWNPAS